MLIKLGQLVALIIMPIGKSIERRLVVGLKPIRVIGKRVSRNGTTRTEIKHENESWNTAGNDGSLILYFVFKKIFVLEYIKP